MLKNEYFSNSYRVLIVYKPFHFLFILLEYFMTFITQITLYTIKFKINLEQKISSVYFYAIFIQQTNKLPEYSKLTIVILIFVLIFVYFSIYTKFAFENKHLFNSIIINIFEIFIFRFILIIIFHILLAIQGIAGIIMIIVSIPLIFLIMKDFTFNHLYYFSPHFIKYPYDYYSSINDLFHIVEKIFLSIALQSSIPPLNEFLYISSIIFQIGNFVYSIYIFYYKSYYIMSNIFLNKFRFSLVASSIIINLILIILGMKNFMIYTFLFLCLNIIVIVFLLIQVFYNPYSKAFFSTDDNIENLYFYYYIIDHLRNDSFILEEKLREHFIKCQKCNLCKNLKSYLSKKKCYKVVYKILYSKVGVLEHTMNEIIHNVLVKGNEALKYNSFYLINLLYCYYLNINKSNYVLSLNLKLLFEIINLENKNILENHLLSTEQITLINEFLSKADGILDKIKVILTESILKEKIIYFFSLYEELFELKSKKFRNKLYYNKNEGIINFFKYISICSMIYEEIFNVSLSNGGISLKENQIFLDDISNKNGINLNQIIIELDLLSFEDKIIYILGELSKYNGKAMCQLFPNIFKTKQLTIMKNKIMNAKYLSFINKDKDFFQNNMNKKGKGDDEQYICLDLLCYDEVKHKKNFAMISLRLNLIYPLNMTKKVLLTGLYSIDKNIIITLDKSTKESKKEIVLNSDEKKVESEIGNYSWNEIDLIKYKNNNKYYNGKKLLFITKYFINPNCYNIYSIFYTEKQRTFKMDRMSEGYQKNNNIYDLESKNNLAESTTHNFNFMMQSQTASTFNQLSNDVQNFKKRDKGGKKDNKKTHYFKYYQIGLLFLSFCIFLFQIIAHITLNNTLIHIGNKNTALTWLKNYYGIYNNVFISTLSIACIAESPENAECESIVTSFINRFLPRGPPGFAIRNFLFNQNRGTITFALINVRAQILNSLSSSNDETMNSLLTSEMTTFSVSQNITNNGTELLAIKQNNSFIDVLNLITSGFIVVTSETTNINDTIYILNRIDYGGDWVFSKEPFKNVKLEGHLTPYQIQFYYLILNYHQFIEKLDAISNILSETSYKTVLNNVSIIKIIIIIIWIAHIFLQVIIYFYIQGYYKILAELFNDIEKKMDLKNDEISVRDMFLQKIEKLKIIISLYKQDIYQAIVDLNFIYDNYKKFIEEKNKEMAKYLKREKFLNEKILTKKDKTKKEIQKIVSSIKSNRLYLYFIAFCSLTSIVISIVLYIIWISYESIYIRIFYLVDSHGNLINDAYKIVNYYELMIYNSITLEDINNFEHFNTSNGDDLFERLYTDLEDLYESRKYMDNLNDYNLDNIDKYFDHNCSSFIDQIFETSQSLIQSRRNGHDLSGFYKSICEMGKVFQSNNYKHIFSMLFEIIQLGINKIKDHSYEGLISYMKSYEHGKATFIFIFVYYSIVEILAFRVQRQSYEKITELIYYYLHTGFIIYYIASFVFIFIIIFVYIYKFNKNYHELHEMKKVFKICNKRE